ncbi:MAG TPA: VacJ family lipoprotein [Pseudoxanthomonas sp.]
MKLLRTSIVVVFAVLASACASAPPAASSTAPADTIVVGEASAPVAENTDPLPATPPVELPADAAPAGDAVATDTAASTEDDFAAIYGQDEYNPIADPNLPPGVVMPVSYDPWEKINRKTHAFNNVIDRTIAKPLAKGYVKVVPRPVRLGVSNFFNNLGQPLSAINSLLQGKPKQAAQATGRFLLNSTLGIGGIFDPASDANLPNKSEDFGQTLGVWGWRRSRYVELPLFGPRTVRDTFGLVGDAPLSPIRQIDNDRTRIFLQGLQLVDVRAQLLSIDSLREGAVDEYALFRDSWLQRRNYQIGQDRKRTEDENLPDYLKEEEENPTVPADAMPVMIPQAGG